MAESINRLLAVGDIHGCRDELQNLLDQVAPGDDDQVVFLGDYVDRGPDPKGVIDDLIEFGRRFPRTVFLKGNHEAMFLDYLADRDRFNFLLNGGNTTLESYQQGDAPVMPESHLDFLAGLRLYFETEGFIFAHAGLRPGIAPQDQVEEDLLWIRGDFLYSDYDWEKTVVFGHTPQKDGPLIEPGKIGLDTGAVYGRTLTCCDVKNGQCWSARRQNGRRKKFVFFGGRG